MGKDLRTSAVQHKLHRYPNLDASPWGLTNLQPFFPPLEKLFKTETVQSLKEYGIRLDEQIDKVVDERMIKTTKGNTIPVHRKTTLLLSHFKCMRGDYGVFGLPNPEEIANDIHTTLQSSNTAGYVGALTSIALSESGCLHFPKVYGVYVALASKHTIDISEDYEEISERRWFADNIGKTFDLKLKQVENTPEFTYTRSQRPALVTGDLIDMDIAEDIDADYVSNPSVHSHESSSQTTATDSLFEADSDSVGSADTFDILSCDCGSSASSQGEEDYGDEEVSFAWATFKNVPVITTVMEVCDGTFYDLVKLHPEPEKHAAWVAQIVLALSYAQRTFGLTHNDLHGNNVMYVPTSSEYLYYKHNGVCLRVPTFGYLIKIIDFDRAIVSLRLIGMKHPRQFVSSQFGKDEEAAGQYNMDPFHNSEYPHIPPNASFDLCRFATSMFWDMFPEGPEYPYTHPLFEVFKQWMKQSDGTSVLFREKLDDHDRYHGFHLYKAIARYCKDNAIPRRELLKLTAFQIPTIPLGAQCLSIEA